MRNPLSLVARSRWMLLFYVTVLIGEVGIAADFASAAWVIRWDGWVIGLIWLGCVTAACMLYTFTNLANEWDLYHTRRAWSAR